MTWPDDVDRDKLNAAADRIMNPEAPNHVALSLLVVHEGELILERYRDGVTRDTRTRTWSTAKSIAAMKSALGSEQAYREFPRRALLDRIGMRSTLVSTDRFGDFILSSQVYTNARDLARFGLLYLNGGTWDGEQLIPEDWIEFVRTPAPAGLRPGFQFQAYYAG